LSAFTVARAEPDDFLAIAALDRVAWRQNRDPEFIPDGEHVWRLWVEHAVVYCARSDGDVVGAIVAFPCTNGHYWVHKLFVAEGHRGKGLGTDLYTTLLADLDERGVFSHLTVDPSNDHAIRLYQRLGYRFQEYVTGYYRQTEDRIIMLRAPDALTRPISPHPAHT